MSTIKQLWSIGWKLTVILFTVKTLMLFLPFILLMALTTIPGIAGLILGGLIAVRTMKGRKAVRFFHRVKYIWLQFFYYFD